MRPLRETALCRLLVGLVLGGMLMWVSAPIAAANPQATAAQTARAYAGAPLERMVAEALVAAANSPDAASAFSSALSAALAAHPDGEALAEIFGEAAPADLLDMLLGELLRGPASKLPHVAAATAAQNAAPASAPLALANDRRLESMSRVVSPTQSYRSDIATSIEETSAARPRAP